MTREGGQGLIVQEAYVLAFDPETRRHIRSGTAVKHHYQVTGDAAEQEYKVETWTESEVPVYDLSEPRSLDCNSILGGGPQMKLKVVASARSYDTRKRKFIPGHRVNPYGIEPGSDQDHECLGQGQHRQVFDAQGGGSEDGMHFELNRIMTPDEIQVARTKHGI